MSVELSVTDDPRRIMAKRHAIAAAALAVTTVVGFAAPARAHSNHNHDRHADKQHGHHDHHKHHGDDQGDQPGVVSIVADNLNNPRQVTVQDNAVYVAEAGTGGDTCFGQG